MRVLRLVARSVLVSLFLSAVFPLAGCEAKAPGVDVYLQNPDGSRTPTIAAEVVATPGERSLGMMYRREMADTSGMLFLFPREEPQQFWMKNTYLELDIIFMDRGFNVVSVVPRATPLTETPRDSGKPAQYVLELLGGSAEKWKIVPGSKAIISGALPSPK